MPQFAHGLVVRRQFFVVFRNGGVAQFGVVLAGAVMAVGAAGASGGSTPGGGVVNINTAGVSELEALPGIGPALAARIVEYRDGHGPFASVDDLTDVPGIGPAKLEALRSQATV